MKKLPYILTRSIQFADDDHLKEQAHENGDEDKSKSGGGGTPDFEARKKAHFAKFGASQTAPTQVGGDINNPPNQEAVKQAKEQAEQRAELDKKRQEEAKNKRPGGNVPQILEGKRQAEAERDELKKKVEGYEKEKPALEAKIKEFETKIAGGELSPAKVKEYEDKIVELETKQREREESLVNETSGLKKRLAFYDLANDPEFKERYEGPVVANHRIALEIIGDDKAKHAALHRALIANATALRAPNAAERGIAEKERNEIISSMLGDMDSFASGRFATAMTNYIETAKQHADALRNHEGTTAKMRAEAAERANASQAERLDTWGKTFDNVAKNYADDEKIEEADVKAAKELGIDIETESKKMSLLAKKVITGQSNMMEAMDIVHRGRINIVLKAKIAVRDKQLADAQALIAKLRGGGTRGGEAGGVGSSSSIPTKSENSAGEHVNKDGQTRKEWMEKRFGASRAVK